MDFSPGGDEAAFQKLVRTSALLLVTGADFHGHFGATDVGTRRCEQATWEWTSDLRAAESCLAESGSDSL